MLSKSGPQEALIGLGHRWRLFGVSGEKKSWADNNLDKLQNQVIPSQHCYNGKQIKNRMV